MDGVSEASSLRKDRSGKALQVNDRVRDGKSGGLRLGTVTSLVVDGKPDCISVDWEGAKRKKPVVAASVYLISEEKEREIKACEEKGKKAFNAAFEWAKCRLQDTQIAELRGCGITQHEWKPDQRDAATTQLAEYGLSLGQLKEDTSKWLTITNTESGQLSKDAASLYG